jgi:hypothetical protein
MSEYLAMRFFSRGARALIFFVLLPTLAVAENSKGIG